MTKTERNNTGGEMLFVWFMGACLLGFMLPHVTPWVYLTPLPYAITAIVAFALVFSKAGRQDVLQVLPAPQRYVVAVLALAGGAGFTLGFVREVLALLPA